jgi:serine/threonine protein kinase
MELLQGKTLAEHLRSKGHMNTALALPLIVQIADALSAAHHAGIIHRDFKPSNVILLDSAEGQKAVVTDFGLARSWSPEGDASLTEAGKMVGTVAYMAPEQLTHGKVTPATDVYPLGLVIYEMVTGRKPFGGEEPMDMVARRLSGLPPPSPSYFSPELDSHWEAAIMRCLHPEPRRRPQTPQEVVSPLKVAVQKAEKGQ